MLCAFDLIVQETKDKPTICDVADNERVHIVVIAHTAKIHEESEIRIKLFDPSGQLPIFSSSVTLTAPSGRSVEFLSSSAMEDGFLCFVYAPNEVGCHTVAVTYGSFFFRSKVNDPPPFSLYPFCSLN